MWLFCDVVNHSETGQFHYLTEQLCKVMQASVQCCFVGYV